MDGPVDIQDEIGIIGFTVGDDPGHLHEHLPVRVDFLHLKIRRTETRISVHRMGC